MKFIYKLVESNFTFSDDLLVNIVVMSLITLVAFKIAFKLVGELYSLDIISGSFSGSIIHWTLRIIALIALFLFAKVVFVIYSTFSSVLHRFL